jgi:hypothetical protein
LTRLTSSVESFEEHGTIHADDEMGKEHCGDYEVMIKKTVPCIPLGYLRAVANLYIAC